MSNQDFDAIVVGSGISGGWAAKELTEKGLKVLLIERGRPITPDDYQGEHKAPWEFPFRGLGDRLRYERDYPIQRSTDYALGEDTEQFFVKDVDHPYGRDPDHPFNWIRGYHLGGRSLTWGRCTPRWGEINFTDNARDGHGVDWPIRYDDIRPWYDKVETFIGVSGPIGLNVPSAPEGRFQPGMPMNSCENRVAEAIAQKFPERRLAIAPSAILTQELNGRAACHYCGPCARGCSTGSYFSSISSTLPAAEATGNLTTITNAIVEGLNHDPKTGKVSGVRVIDTNSRARSTYRGRIVFLNASTLGTTQILLNSKSEKYPTGLGNTSGVLGHYLLDHLMTGSAFGMVPGMYDKHPIGNRPAGLYMARFQNLDKKDKPYLRGFGFQGAAFRMNWARGTMTPGFGADFKKGLRELGPWVMYLGGFGECLPYYENSLSLDPVKKDKWGIPILNTRFEWGDNERAMATEMAAEAKAMLEAAGAQGVQANAAMPIGGLAIHEMGTARMGRDPKTSYLNGFNQAHEVSNLFVTDGACMTSTACQNPSLTYMALTARAVDHAVGRMKQGQL
ncbi:MAG: GMC family oxidoreductase [Pseudomonadota bacterium]|uniref:GMC oxidoreductase n=1 Tax=Sphingomonas sp. ERG5 TaxID=1381597 RepID=UPI00054BD118|nr:GMC family oxidoreductase [Sphingomonas sp. ERG5]